MKELPSELVAGVCFYLNKIELTHVEPIFTIVRTEYFNVVWKSTHFHFILCCSRGYINAVRSLMKKDVRESSLNAGFICALSTGQHKIIKLLLTLPISMPENAIIYAVRHNLTTIVKLLLVDQRVDPGYSNNRAIKLAADEGYIEIAKLLLADPRVAPGANDNHAIKRAIQRHDLEMVQHLLADPRVNANGASPIKWATQHNYRTTASILRHWEKVNYNYLRFYYHIVYVSYLDGYQASKEKTRNLEKT